MSGAAGGSARGTRSIEGQRLPTMPLGQHCQVLLMVGQSRSNAKIAELLVIADSTAKTHVKRVLAKINARDRPQAVVFAYRSGLITASD
jgi:DNA-binding CsgD family transcriptional regulator